MSGRSEKKQKKRFPCVPKQKKVPTVLQGYNLADQSLLNTGDTLQTRISDYLFLRVRSGDFFANAPELWRCAVRTKYLTSIRHVTENAYDPKQLIAIQQKLERTHMKSASINRTQEEYNREKAEYYRRLKELPFPTIFRMEREDGKNRVYKLAKQLFWEVAQAVVSSKMLLHGEYMRKLRELLNDLGIGP